MSRAKAGARYLFHLAVGATVVMFYLTVVVPWSRFSSLNSRRRGLRPRIVWGPTPIINIRYSSLADREYGYPSATLVLDLYTIDAPDDYDVVLRGRLAPYRAFLHSGFGADVFGFFFDGGMLGGTPWWNVELVLLRLAGKRILVYPYGSDARLASVTRASGGWNAYSLIAPGEEDRDERAVRARLAAFGKHATVILGCADLVDHLPRLDGIMRYPFDDRGWTPAPARPGESVVVVHAPNHRQYKGTEFIIAAVEELAAEGIAIELDLVEQVPRTEARARYARAHIIVDQLLIGAYALFAIEGMALGKPVVCYLADQFRPRHPEWDDCPIVNADPDTITPQLRRLVLDPAWRADVGALGPDYVRQYHSLASVGDELDAIYRRVWR